MAAVCLLSSSKKADCCRGFQLCKSVRRKNPRDSGKLFNTHSTDLWDNENGQQFTLLKWITNSKSVNSDIVLPSIVSLERLSPEGLIPPCRTTVWVTHLLRNIIANFCCGVHRSCTDNPYKLTWKISWLNENFSAKYAFYVLALRNVLMQHGQSSKS